MKKIMMNAMMKMKKSTHNENKQTNSHCTFSLLSNLLIISTHMPSHLREDACISLHNFYSSIFPYCRLKMRRPHILFPLLLLCLMLMTFQQIYATTSSTFQETTTGKLFRLLPHKTATGLNHSCFHPFVIKDTCFNKGCCLMYIYFRKFQVNHCCI